MGEGSDRVFRVLAERGRHCGRVSRWLVCDGGPRPARCRTAASTLRGRATELIISGGFNIYPREIEEVLLEQDGVREAAVVGTPDERRGEVPVAYVVTDGDVDLERLRERCAAEPGVVQGSACR